MSIKVEQLTAEAFGPFGNIIEADPKTSFEINSGYTTRFHNLSEADVGDGHAIISIFRGRPRELSVGMLERHPLGSQAFIPLGEKPWLAVVASTPDISACRAFLVQGHQGLQYDVNVWHHPLLVIDTAQDFLIVDRAGDGDNLEEVFFDDAVSIAY